MVNVPLKQYWALLARHIRPQRTRFTLLAVLLLSGIALQLVNPQIVRTYIDAATTGADETSLLRAAIAFLSIALIGQAISIATRYLGENVAWTATNALRQELARHCLYLDMGFHTKHTPGELIERIDGDVAQLATFFSQLVINVVGNVVLMVGVVVALFLEDWRLGAAFAPFAVVVLVVLERVRDIAVPHNVARRQANADLFGYLEEQLVATEDICASGAAGFAIQGLYRHQRKVLQTDYRASLVERAISLTTHGTLTIGHIAAFVLSYVLYQRGALTLGGVYLIINYFMLLSRPIRDLVHQMEGMQTIGASVGRLTDLGALTSAVVDGEGAALGSGAAALSFERVGFAYVSAEPVLRDVSFCLAPGCVLGLLGRTGSGKTTMGRLVFRFYDAGTGSVRLDGVDVRHARMRQVRDRIAIVTQNVELFQATVRDNLTLFDHTIADTQILEAIHALELGEWYASLPEGLDTHLESGARNVSAGEAQLLAFARVFLRDPGLVILDEASSRLDPATERSIERAIDRLLHERTAIIIAHRLETLHRADEIMILEEGCVSEHGDRRALAADPGSRFHALLQTGLEEVLA